MSSEADGAPAAVLVDVAKTFGDVTALAGITLKLEPGVTGLIGVNGAGKSTLLNLVSGAARPTSGQCVLFSEDTRSAVSAQVQRRIGLMPQSLTVPPSLTVKEFLAYMSWVRGFPRRERAATMDQAVQAADLSAEMGKRVGALSGGMHRRLLLGQALIGEPELVLLDEPTAGLDPEQRLRVRELIAQFPADRTTVVSSHLMEDLAPIADTIVMLNDARLAFVGSRAEFRAIGEQAVAPDSGISADEAAFVKLRSGSPA